MMLVLMAVMGDRSGDGGADGDGAGYGYGGVKGENDANDRVQPFAPAWLLLSEDNLVSNQNFIRTAEIRRLLPATSNGESTPT